MIHFLIRSVDGYWHNFHPFQLRINFNNKDSDISYYYNECNQEKQLDKSQPLPLREYTFLKKQNRTVKNNAKFITESEFHIIILISLLKTETDSAKK